MEKKLRVKFENKEYIFPLPRTYQIFKEECGRRLKINMKEFDMFSSCYRDPDGDLVLFNSSFDYNKISKVLQETKKNELEIMMKREVMSNLNIEGKMFFSNDEPFLNEVESDNKFEINNEIQKKKENDEQKEKEDAARKFYIQKMRIILYNVLLNLRKNPEKNEVEDEHFSREDSYEFEKHQNLPNNKENLEQKNQRNPQIDYYLEINRMMQNEHNLLRKNVKNNPQNTLYNIDKIKNEIENAMKEKQDKFIKVTQKKLQEILQTMQKQFSEQISKEIKTFIESIQPVLNGINNQSHTFQEEINKMKEFEKQRQLNTQEKNKELQDEINKLKSLEEEKKKQLLSKKKEEHQVKYNPMINKPKVNTIHKGIQCNKCGSNPIIGIRYKCSDCPLFNLCEKCEEENLETEEHSHDFIKIKKFIEQKQDSQMINNNIKKQIDKNYLKDYFKEQIPQRDKQKKNIVQDNNQEELINYQKYGMIEGNYNRQSEKPKKNVNLEENYLKIGNNQNIEQKDRYIKQPEKHVNLEEDWNSNIGNNLKLEKQKMNANLEEDWRKRGNNLNIEPKERYNRQIEKQKTNANVEDWKKEINFLNVQKNETFNFQNPFYQEKKNNQIQQRKMNKSSNPIDQMVIQMREKYSFKPEIYSDKFLKDLLQKNDYSLEKSYIAIFNINENDDELKDFDNDIKANKNMYNQRSFIKHNFSGLYSKKF